MFATSYSYPYQVVQDRRSVSLFPYSFRQAGSSSLYAQPRFSIRPDGLRVNSSKPSSLQHSGHFDTQTSILDSYQPASTSYIIYVPAYQIQQQQPRFTPATDAVTDVPVPVQTQTQPFEAYYPDHSGTDPSASSAIPPASRLGASPLDFVWSDQPRNHPYHAEATGSGAPEYGLSQFSPPVTYPTGPKSGYAFPAVPVGEHNSHLPGSSPDGSWQNARQGADHGQIRGGALNIIGTHPDALKSSPSSTDVTRKGKHQVLVRELAPVVASNSTYLSPSHPSGSADDHSHLLSNSLGSPIDIPTTHAAAPPLADFSQPSEAGNSSLHRKSLFPLLSRSLSFSSLLLLSDMARKSRSAKTRHLCKVCDQTFSRAHDLRRHTAIHAPVKAFDCPNCSKSFTRKDALKRHLEVRGIHHSDHSKKKVPSNGWNAGKKRNSSSAAAAPKAKTVLTAPSTATVSKKQTMPKVVPSKRRKSSASRLLGRRRSSAKTVQVETIYDSDPGPAQAHSDDKDDDAMFSIASEGWDGDNLQNFNLADFLPPSTSATTPPADEHAYHLEAPTTSAGLAYESAWSAGSYFSSGGSAHSVLSATSFTASSVSPCSSISYSGPFHAYSSAPPLQYSYTSYPLSGPVMQHEAYYPYAKTEAPSSYDEIMGFNESMNL